MALCLQDKCKSLVLQDKYNIEIFLSPAMVYFFINGFIMYMQIKTSVDPDHLASSEAR